MLCVIVIVSSFPALNHLSMYFFIADSQCCLKMLQNNLLLIASTGPEENCDVPADPAYPLCAQKVEVRL